MLNITFIGTGAGVPSRHRGMSCVAIKHNKSVYLFDCAEGTQRQIMISNLSYMKVDAIFLTHLHGDHIFGVPGLLQTMEMGGRKKEVTICGPEGTKNTIKSLLKSSDDSLSYEVIIKELQPGECVDFNSCSVTCFKTIHGVPSIGYVFREKDYPGKFNKNKAIELGLTDERDYKKLVDGKTVNGVKPEQVIGKPRKGLSVVYSGDTIPCDETIKYSKNVDVLIHESTYSSEDFKKAEEHNHSTCVQAAEIAKKAGVKKLFLIHFSHRYDDCSVLEDQAKKVFSNTSVTNDLDSYNVDLKQIKQVSTNQH